MIAINNNLALKTVSNISKNVMKMTGLYLITAVISKELKSTTGELSELATQGIRRLRSKFEHN